MMSFEPITIVDQGSFFAGGTIKTWEGTFDPYHPTDAGQTLRGDHSYCFYEIPANARKYPLVFLHGFGQSGKTWETTPDGREGFQTIFLRRGFGTYVLDQARRGKAGKTAAGCTNAQKPDEQYQVFDIFRMGIWPDYFENVQMARDEETFDQFCRQCTCDTGTLELAAQSSSVAAACDRIGDCILVSHSMGGGMGWAAALKSPAVKAIVSFEPGSNFVFPEGEVPDPMPSSAGPLEAYGVPLETFKALTKIPVVIYYGDNIPAEPNANPGQDQWRVRIDMARLWADAVNRHGGNAKVYSLPEDFGIYGNTHFPFADLNNIEIADLMSKHLHAMGVD